MSPRPGFPRGEGENFFLDIPFHRMSEIGDFTSTTSVAKLRVQKIGNKNRHATAQRHWQWVSRGSTSRFTRSCLWLPYHG